MQQKIFDPENSYKFFTGSRKIVLEEETNLKLDSSSKFGIDLADTGNFYLIISTELTEETIGISNNRLKKYPILLKFVRDETISNEKYLVFSAIFCPVNIPLSVEIFLVKRVIVHCLIKLVSSRTDNFSILNLMKVKGLDMLEYLD